MRGAFASGTPPRGGWRARAWERRLRLVVPSATALLLFALAAGVALAGGSRSARAQAPSSAPQPPPVRKRALAPVRALYRIVGCRSRGQVAYRHGPHLREVAIGFDDGPASLTPAFVRTRARRSS